MKALGAGYRKRVDGRLEYRWTQDGKRYSVAGKTIEECKAKETRKRKILEHGANPSATLNDFFEGWIRNRDGVVKSSTIRKNKSIFKIISPELGDKKICDIDQRQVMLFRDTLKDVYNTNYINQIIKLLSSVLCEAVLNSYLDYNPCEGVKNLKRTEPEARETIHRALTVEETTEFFEAAAGRNSWYLPLYEFLINTGCRIGEAGALQWSDIDLKNNVIHIRRTITAAETGYEIGDSPKTDSSKRDIPMNAAIKAAIQKQEQANREMFGDNVISMNDRIFKAFNGGFVCSDVVVRDMKVTLKDTSIKYFTPGGFRDTFATRAIETGMQPNTLKEILGHDSFSMTMDLYVHVMENTKQKEMNLLEGVLI